MPYDDDLLARDDDAAIVQEAQDRFKYALSWESDARRNWVQDYKFANGDAFNLYQWPYDEYNRRQDAQQPSLTVNKVRVHNNLIINDARQNKPSIKVRPVNDEASYEAAEVLEGIMRHIEYQSKAQVAYDTATGFQVDAGLGYLLVETDYAGEDTFDQEIYIRRVKDPLSVLCDPDCKEEDWSDQRFAFIFDDVPRDEFNSRYPEWAGEPNVSLTALGIGSDDWLNEEHVRVAEYWRVMEVEDELLWMLDPQTGQKSYALASKVPSELVTMVKADPTTQTRKTTRRVVQHFMLVGSSVAKRERWVGRYIPIVPVIGSQTVIERRLDRRGHTRMMRDPQQNFNYWLSAATANIALQSNTPYVSPARAIEGLETYWEAANTQPTAVLPYNDVDDDGNPIAAPQRQPGPQVAAGYMAGMQFSEQQLMMVSGQEQAQLGQPGNERSGYAINQRQRQADMATYQYVDNLATSIRQVGRICLDLAPKVYDQPRVMRILGEDGTERRVEIDPKASQAYQKREEKQQNAVREIFNPNLGQYDVQADVGPNYATARQEAWNAFVQIATANPQIMQVAGDLMFRAADFPMADDIAERLYRTIPPGITGDAPPEAFQQAMQGAQQQIQMLMQQNEQLRAQLQGAAAKLTEKDLQLTAEDQKRIIEAYRAETDRIKALAPTIDPQEAAQLAAQLVMDAMKNPIGPATQAAETDLARAAGSFGGFVQPAGQGYQQAALANQNGTAGTGSLGRAANAEPGTPLNGPQAGGLPPQILQALAAAQQHGGGASQPPGNGSGLPPGARLAQDGSHYVPDPNRPGRYLLVV